MVDAVVAILLVRAAAAALKQAAVATAVRPAQAALRGHLVAVGDLADAPATMRPAMTITLCLARASFSRACFEAAMLEAALVQLGAVGAAGDRTSRTTAMAHAATARHRDVLTAVNLARRSARLAHARALASSRRRRGAGRTL